MSKRDAEERDYDDELDEDDEAEESFSREDDELESELLEADLVEDWCPKCKAMKPHQVLHDGSRNIVCAECNHEHKREKNIPEAAPIVYGLLTNEEKADINLRKDAWKRLTYAASETEIKKYTIHAQFAEGDIINHVKFGRGVVVENIEKTKVDVLFSDGEIKLLVCGK